MNLLPIVVSDPDQLLTSGAFGSGALILIESSATSGSGYAQIGTLPILASTFEYTYYDTAGPTGQWYRTRYSDAGQANFSDYSDERQAPTANGLCSVYDVRSRLSGDNPNDGGQFVNTLAGKVLEVSADIERLVARARAQEPDRWHFLADASPSLRAFTAKPGWPSLVLIDDCVEVTSVQLVSNGQVVQTLVSGTDFVPYPVTGSLPITGLQRLVGGWPSNVAGVQVTARWGYGSSVPYDVREQTIVETIRAYLSDRAGNNDTVGVTPFGTAQFSRAYSSKTMQLVSDYRLGSGWLR